MRVPRTRRLTVATLCLWALAGDASAQPGAAIAGLAPGVWTWVPIPEARCEDGTATGLGVSRGEGPDVLVYLDGGGACWDLESCVRDERYRHGPWARTEHEARVARFGGSIFDRGEPRNPFRAFHHVFVPYCTADVHSGDRATTYARRTLQHRGRANVAAFAARIAATFPGARRIVVAGSSAGGYGALVNYDLLRRRWPRAQGFLIDDSGPALRGVPRQAVREAWWRAWGTPWASDGFCPACRDDVAAVWAALAGRWPGDRIAFLSSLRDDTMVWYLRTDADTFERALRATLREVLAPLPGARAFTVPGDGHTMLLAPGEHDRLWEWLAGMVDGDAGWRSAGPATAPRRPSRRRYPGPSRTRGSGRPRSSSRRRRP